MKKFILIFLLTGFMSLSATGSGNTVENYSVEAAVDGDITTSTRFKLGETLGWFKIPLEKKSLVRYVNLNGEIPKGVTAYIEYNQDGFIKSFPSSFVTDVTGEYLIDLTEDRVITDEIYVRFSGENLSDAVIYEVTVKTEDISTIVELKPLVVTGDSTSSSSYTGAQHLVDGLIGTVWRTWNNEDWGKSHWFVLEEIKRKHPHSKSYSSWQTGFAKLNPEVIDEYREVKIYVDPEATGIMDISIQSEKHNGKISTLDLDNHRGEWLTLPLNEYGKLSEIRLDTKSSQKVYSGIGEVQLWGDKNPQINEIKDVIPYNLTESLNEAIFSIETIKYDERFSLDIVVENNSIDEVKTYINNKLTEVSKSGIINGYTRLRYLLTDRELLTGDNFLKCELPLDAKVIYGSIRKLKKQETIKLSETGISDNRLYSGNSAQETELVFSEGKGFVERVRVYYKDYAPEGVYLKLDEYKHFPTITTNNPEYVEFEVNDNFDRIIIENPLGATEVVAYGNNLEIKNPFIRIIFPGANESMEVQELGYKPIWGITDSPDANITINGIDAKTYGNYFWIDEPGKELRKTGAHTIFAELIDGDGVSASDKIEIVLQANSHEFTLDQAERIYYTKEDSFTFSGRYNPWNSKLYFNDTEIDSANNMNFSYVYYLEEGLNVVYIVLKDKKGTKTKEIHKRMIYKQSLPYSLSITSPTNNSFTNRDKIDVTGFASPQELSEVKVNGVTATISNGRYLAQNIPLNSDVNTITVESLYNSGESVVKSVTVLKDTVAPEVIEVLPAPDSWFASPYINVTGKVVEDNSFSVYVNSIKATITGETFSANIPLKEVQNSIEITAKDSAGNSYSYPVFNLNADFTKPKAFNVTKDPASWTNNRRPTLTFSTEDTLTGISHYEVSVDGAKFVKQTSPFRTPFLDDGEIPVIVRAYDKVGNYRDSSVTLLIDTLPPDEADDFRVIAGNGSAVLKWSDSDDETVKYIISDNTNSYIVTRDQFVRQNDEKTVDFYEYEVEGLENGVRTELNIIAVDRAGNIGNPVTDDAITGITFEEYNDEEGTIVEYEDVVLIVPKESLPEEVEKVIITEVESEDMTEKAVYPIISPILDFSVLKKDETEAKHISFEEGFVCEISYDDKNEMLKAGYPEQNLGVYYFDENWSRWVQVKDSGVDTENNKIYFKTTHFTSFSVQPTVFEDLTPQELSSVEFSPFSSKVAHQPVTVSAQNGGASTSMTELSLPGKNGFDFELRRIYDTTTARGDAAGLNINVSVTMSDVLKASEVAVQLLTSAGLNVLGQVENSIKKYFKNNGDYAYALGQGWRLNLPYIRGNNGGVLVRTPSGSFYDITSMNLRLSESLQGGVYRKLTFENHESEDFVLIVEQVRSDISVTNIVSTAVANSNSSQTQSEKDTNLLKSFIPGWNLHSAKLILKDGSSYVFDGFGRFRRSIDPSGLNTVTAEYNDLLLDNITDSMGRVIKFSYTDNWNTTVVPQIEKIWIQDDPLNREIEYFYGNPSDMRSELNIVDPVALPLLQSATDINDREWDYDYDFRFLFAGEFGAKLNVLAGILALCSGGVTEKVTSLFDFATLTIYARANLQWVFPMDYLDGPGLGTTSLSYDTKNLGYFHVGLTDYFLGIFPVAAEISVGLEQRPYVDRLRLSLEGETVRTENYSYSYKYAGNKQYYTKKTIKDDGKLKEITEFEIKRKTRLTVFDWSDYVIDNITSPFRDSVWREDIIPLNSKTSYYDSKTGAQINSIEKSYYKSNLQLREVKNIRSDENFATQSFIYDGWGNQIKITNETVSNEHETKSVTYQVFNSTPVSNFPPQASFYEELFNEAGWDRTKLKSDPTLKSFQNERHNLLMASKTFNYDLYNGTETVTEQYNDYNNFGQLSSSMLNTENGWAETTFEYGYDDSIVTELESRASGNPHVPFTVKPYETLTGELTKTTTPTGQVINREYDFSSDRVYTVKETYKDITNIENDTTTDISTFKGYDRVMGYLMWSTDANGFTTEFNFDKLGRRTKIIYPDDDDDPSWNPVTTPTNATRNNNPKTVVVYDDATLLVTETKVNGTKTEYQFDNLSRLLSISKLDGSHLTRFDYDGWNNIIKFQNPNGDITEFTYNPLGEIASEIYTEKSSSDGAEIQKKKRVAYYYSELGKLTTNENGISIKNNYDFNNNIIMTTYYGEYGEIRKKEHFFYDGAGNLVATKDALGNVTKNFYNSRNQHLTTTLPEAIYEIDGVEITASAYTRSEYDLAGNKIAEVIGAPGAEDIRTDLTLDGIGRTIKQSQSYTDVDGTKHTAETKLVYDNNGNVIRTIDPNGSVWEKSYFARNNVEFELDPFGNRTTYEYDIADRLTKMTDPRENSGNYTNLDFSIEYIYDDLDRLVEAKLPARLNRSTGVLDAKPVITFDYDLLGNVLTRTEPDLSTTTYTYSSRKRVLTETKTGVDKDGADRSYTTKFEYDPAGNLIRKTMPDGVTFTSFTYDVFNQVKAEKINDEAATSYSYDYNGNRIRVRNPNGFDHYYSYDALNRLEKETDYKYESSQFKYDIMGNVSYLKDFIGNEYRSTYNETGKLIKEVNGRGKVKSYYYDGAGNLVKDIDANGTVSTYDVLANNLLGGITYTSKDGSATQSVSYDYDEAGAVKSVTDSGITTKYNYLAGNYVPDPYDQQFVTETVGYNTVKYDYDYMSRMTAMTYNSGEVVDYNYNTLSQLESITGYVDSLTYTDNGYMAQAMFNNGVSLDYTYTSRMELGSIAYSKDSAEIKGFTYTYDMGGNITQENDNLYGYDGKNQLTTAMLTGAAAEEEYTLDGIDTGEALNDVIGEMELKETSLSGDDYSIDWGAKSFGIDLNYSYRVKKISLNRNSLEAHRITKDNIAIYHSNFNRDQAFMEAERYTLVEDDLTGNITLEFETAIFARYFKVHSHFNDLDADGNPLKIDVTFKLDKDNPLTVVAVTGGRNEFYTLDAKGNRVKRTIMSKEFLTDNYSYYTGSDLLKDDGKHGYIYDDNGNLITKGDNYTVTDDVVTIIPTGYYFEYVYDLKNRLVEAKKYDEGLQSVITVATYLYDANNYRIEKTDRENNKTSFVFDIYGNCIEENTDTTQTNYIFMNNRHIAKVVNGTEKYFYGSNNVGSTVLLTDSEGKAVWNGDITPYGDKQEITGDLTDSVFYTGKMKDPDTNLYYFNARWYDSNIGRFITEDPIKDGNNWYVYCNNNPLRFVDHDGKFALSTAVAYGIGIGATALVIYIATDDTWAEACQEASRSMSRLKEKHDLYVERRIAELEAEWLATKRTRTEGIPSLKAESGNTEQEEKANSEEAEAAESKPKDPRARGRESEKRVLDDMGLEKNNDKVTTDEGNSIPDALTEDESIEIKDTKVVNRTRQVRIQTEAAAKAGKSSTLVTGTKTKVSDPAQKAFDEIIRRDDLGPQE